MYSISILTKNAENFEVQKGLKSLSIITNRKQYIEIQTGLKSLSISLAIPGGSAIKIKHYR